MGIPHAHGQRLVSEQFRDVKDVDALHHQARSECMAQVVPGEALRQASFPHRPAEPMPGTEQPLGGLAHKHRAFDADRHRQVYAIASD